MADQTLDAVKKLTLGQKILIGVATLICLGFVGYMNFSMKSSEQATMQEFYQNYTEKANALITASENYEVNGQKQLNRWMQEVSYITSDGQEISSSKLANGSDEVLGAVGETVEILYDPTNPASFISVKEYEKSTGMNI